jgi:SAM-dependent methyltransferase
MLIKRSFFVPFDQRVDVEGLEAVDCALCGSAAFRLLGREGVFEIRRCRGCGLVYVSPQPTREELPKFYENMFAEDTERTMQRRSRPGPVERHLRGIIGRRCPGGGRLLEVGCGYGNLLKHLEALPFELHGLEVSPAVAQAARAHVPAARIGEGVLEEAAFPDEAFDCIALVAVLEHVKDPRRAVGMLHRWLRPGGAVVIQVPYIQHFFRLARFVPFVPFGFEAPRHLFDFSPRTLPRFLREAGFDDVRVEVARPYMTHSRLVSALVWAVKAPGLALYALTGGRWVYPYAAAIVVHARKP